MGPSTLAVTFTKQGLVKAGFDTGGINNTSHVQSPLKIQVALLLDGVAYETLVPVPFISEKGATTGTISGAVDEVGWKFGSHE